MHSLVASVCIVRDITTHVTPRGAGGQATQQAVDLNTDMLIYHVIALGEQQ